MFLSRLRIDAEVTGYANNLPIVDHLKHNGGFEFHQPVTVFVGDNGTGKSTLLEAIATAMGINPEGGTTTLMRFDYASTESELSEALVMTRRQNPQFGLFLRGETFFNFASEHDAAVEKTSRLHPQSHGQSVQDFLQRYLKTRGLFIFDEPESGLSPMAQLVLLGQIYHAAQAGSQFIIATHSVILPAIPGADLYEITEEEIAATTFDDLSSVAVTQEFLADPHGVADYVCELGE